jgi:TonB-dependent SusC/RagA subfamily outer membrane receptor
MKKIVIIVCITFLLHPFLYGQTEKEITPTIKKVTVFTEGAQIENDASFFLQPGQMTLKLTGLSPYIRKESIRINGDGSFLILNVQQQTDYLNELDKSREIESQKNKIEELQSKVEDEETWLKILKEKSDFLEANKDLAGKDKTVDPEIFKSLTAIYGGNIESLNLELLKRQRLIKSYKKDIDKLNNQLNSLSSKSDLPSGTIILTIDSKVTRAAKLSFNYIVDNAAWYPSYDIRFIAVNKPLTVTYKANIRQNTGTDWKNINLVLSTARTNISAQIPEFSPFYLQFFYPEITNALQGKVAGLQITEYPSSLRSESQIILRGNRSMGSNNIPLYVVDGVPQSNIESIDPNEIDRIEVLKDASAAALYGARGSNGVVIVTTKQNKEKSSVPMTITSRRVTSNEYFVDAQQTILSNNKTTSVTFKEAELNADFEYQAIPSLSENVFLIGKISNWYKAELSDGDVNVYLENSYVGKSLINTEQFKDTLDISFGIDNNLSIKRERIAEYTENQFIGSNRKETIGFKITTRNNKPYPVTTKIIDQIPVSTNREIQVEPLVISGGKLDVETGKIVWELTLNPNESKDFIIKYSVKYPKDKKVIIE